MKRPIDAILNSYKSSLTRNMLVKYAIFSGNPLLTDVMGYFKKQVVVDC
ncbi:MAG: hypothetical protein IPF68_16905 [Bacteroidales bacterium]|nr:hypothetical protein [Bacteroidales bacterium]